LIIVNSESGFVVHELSPLVKSLKETFKAPVSKNYKRALAKGLSKIYLEEDINAG
jgi:hypothetical protein